MLAMNNIKTKTPGDIGRKIAENMRAHRKMRKFSMERLSEISGVSLGSIKRFESSGEISLKSLSKIAIVLDCADELEQLFAKKKPQSIREIIDGNL